jgi:hypothetical protein
MSRTDQTPSRSTESVNLNVAFDTLWLDSTTAPTDMGLIAGDFPHNDLSALDNALSNICVEALEEVS